MFGSIPQHFVCCRQIYRKLKIQLLKMNIKFVLLFCVLAITQISAQEATKFCTTLGENYQICMDNVIPKMANSFLENGDFSEIDPLKIESLTIYKKMNKDVEFQGNIEDIVVRGLQSTNVERFRLDPETLEGYVHITIPFIHSKSEYSMVLKFANTNTTYNGMSFGNATDIDVQLYFQLDKIVKSDVEYFTIKNMKGKIFVKKMQVVSKTFDPAQQSAADFFVNYFNKNYKRLLNAPDSMFQKYAIMMIRIMAEEFLSIVPAEQMM